MKDAQVQIRNFNIYRSDRKIREHGGALLYIHESIAITECYRYDDDICQGIFCLSPSTCTMLACVYKPCDASNTSFFSLLQFLQSCIDKTDEAYKFTKIFLGDLNFPDLWNPFDPRSR